MADAEAELAQPEVRPESLTAPSDCHCRGFMAKLGTSRPSKEYVDSLG